VALARLAELKMILGLPEEGENFWKMAQNVQKLLSNRESLPPESEGASCR
jgi:hypothetical protein